ncbi:MAG TPA: PPK2 family polyphosphate kinase [Chthoniobacterales bacterium]|jgi:PPK2 family polyphosphate:nucleotide phosphotransferase|nr:PPK2 family polyphosphate kinase [Chthoniobacterales bacterium]
MKSAAVKARRGDKIRLSEIDQDDTGGMDKEEACARFADLREKISLFQEKLFAEHDRSLLILFQAMDTGGKDGALKALCFGLNPAGLEIARFKAPTPAELDHDFLWRAHKSAPSKGMIGIWNRSHYEDVLVVRAHKLVSKKTWRARYDQINKFEKILTENGTTIVKFMLHISKDEQKERLQQRIDDPNKRWKFSPSDLKERQLWSDYQKAYEDAINCCATDYAPWYIVPANHKWARDFAIVEVVSRALKKMKPNYPKLRFDPAVITIE